MILVFGKSGQVAQEIARAAPGALCLGRDDADLTVPGAAADAIRRHGPTAVINAAAWTAVDAAEDERAAAHRLNADAPAEIAAAAAGIGAALVHISTDYVFDGTGERPWRPDDPTGPQSAYGETKLAGERAVAEAMGQGAWAVLRTSWVFSAHGGNFVKTMLRVGATRDRLGVVDDQTGGPTPAADIAAATLRIADALTSDPGLSGVYHFSGAPDVTWAGFARAIFGAAGMATAVDPIATADWPTPAARPANSRLDCSATKAAFGIDRPDWRTGLDAVLAELRETETTA